MSVSAPRVLTLFAIVGAIGLVVALSPAGAQSAVTFVDSDITADTTWSAEDGPYRLVGNVTVTEDTTLRIRPGTTVEFAEGVSLSVAGDVFVNGTADESVRLVASREASTAGTWGSIRTIGTGSPSVSLAHTELVDATDGVTVRNPDTTLKLSETVLRSLSGSGINVRTADGRTNVAVTESRFQDIGAAGIVAERTEILPVEAVSDWSITSSTFDGLGDTGISLQAERTTGLTVRTNRFDGIDGPAVGLGAGRIRASQVRSNTVVGSAQAVAVDTADISALSIVDNDIGVTDTGIDVSLEQNVYRLEIHENRIDGGDTGISIDHDPRSGGYYSFDLSVIENEVRNQTGSGITLTTSLFSDSALAVRNNTVSDTGRDGIRLAVGAFQQAVLADNRLIGNARRGLSLSARHVRNTVVRGNLARDNGAAGVEIRAAQEMEGVNVTANELLDNAREGLVIRTSLQTDSEYTISANVVAANAYGIVLSGPQTGVLSENAIVFNTVAFDNSEARSDAKVGIGVLVTSGATDVELVRNDIYGNEVGLQTRINGTVSAAKNYWGAATGPYHRSINPEGDGNAVVTDWGWVELIEVRSERVGPAYSRPTPALDIDPTPGRPGQPVTISAAKSGDADGEIHTYRFSIDGRTTVGGTARRTATFEEIGSYPVSVWVEDDMGIESAAPATGLVQIEPVPTTAAPQTTTQGSTQSPVTATTTDQDRGGPGLLGWVGGFIGAVFYGTALVLGGRGMYETLMEQPLSVRGRRIQVLAITGVLVWAIASVPGPTVLRRFAAIGIVVWGGLTGIAFGLVKLR